jgi:uncharacterized membrane protein YphA (DoxX/SURF4 family)
MKDERLMQWMRGVKGRVPIWLPVLCGAAMGLLFILSGAGKILHPAGFAFAVFRYHLVPHPLVNAAALVLAWLELVCGLGVLFFPRYRNPALALIFLLLVVFTVGISFNLLRGVRSACGCFSTSLEAEPMTWWKVARNLGLLLLTGLALLRHPAELKPR